MRKIEWDINKCYGCKTCEFACSFHQGKVFSPELSSIKVYRNNRTGVIKWSIDYSTCDFCEGEETPLCVKYCPYGALNLSLKEVTQK